MPVRRLLIVFAVLALAALIAVGLVQASRQKTSTLGPTGLTVAQMQERLAGSPPALAALHAQADRLLPGKPETVRRRLDELHGEPIVVTKWASWCEPCKEDMPLFQRASLALGKRVAFVGIDSNDSSKSGPLAQLRTVPLPFPSYYDPSGQTGTAVTGSAFTPVTVFFNRKGGEFIRQGAFPSLAKLEADIRHYALDD
ncbi:MAG TPA: TlpA disulfide reductase family protein [Solirubrobacteraceae bacterium]|nr:TlpA disulfide reductase family protein [Solirubrobacteraceae bacterium]